MKFNASLFLMSFFIANAFAQENKRIHHLEKVNQIEFRSANNKVLKRIDVIANNKYAKLSYEAKTTPGGIVYRIGEAERAGLVNSFFIHAPDELKRVNPTHLKASSDVMLSQNHVVVADHLTMYGGGILGVKAIATVYNKEGTIIATMPENNDGYYSPVVTADGKYLATNYGDIVPDTDYSLMPLPGFRIYDINTGIIMYKLESSAQFDVLPPISDNNMIIEVVRFPNSQYDYLFFQPDRRKLFRKRFSGEEVGRFVRFTTQGVVIKNNGKDFLVEFNKEFAQASF